MKKAIGYILIAIIMLGIGFGGAYLLYGNKKCTNNSTKKEEKISTTKNLSIYSDEVINATEAIKLNTVVSCGANSNTAYFKNSKVTSENIDPVFLYLFIENNHRGSKDSISLEDWTKEVQKIFGENVKIDPTVAEKNKYCADHYYNQETKAFEYQETACGCTWYERGIIVELSKAEEKDDTLEIEVKTIFTNDKDNKYYKDTTYTMELTDLDVSQDEFGYVDPVVSNKNMKKAGTYKLTFKKNKDGSYYFVSSELIG